MQTRKFDSSVLLYPPATPAQSLAANISLRLAVYENVTVRAWRTTRCSGTSSQSTSATTAAHCPQTGCLWLGRNFDLLFETEQTLAICFSGLHNEFESLNNNAEHD
eukprot:TRINITY_DN34120_c0_g1_i1.p1 TRINITY_DN34120_c0_g1~~TRINITY_DN34120_c0_g1_i1.p1  ORF type:complete len:106 (-),score=8.33 TRINITY_DN34120_c0_g1_i1:229-546(-)